MNKKENYAIVLKAEEEVKAELTPKTYYMLGHAQRMQLIQDKLPLKPLFCTNKIAQILKENGKH